MAGDAPMSDEMWKLIHAYNERGERLKQAMEIVRAVADANIGEGDVRTIWTDGYPIWTRGHWAYIPVEFQEQARALLAAESEGSADDGG
jgi:hypothetical protein